MKRRTFLKGLAMLTGSTMIPALGLVPVAKPKMVIDKGLSDIALTHVQTSWVGAEIFPLADLECTAKTIRESTGYKPDTITISEEMFNQIKETGTMDLGFNSLDLKILN